MSLPFESPSGGPYEWYQRGLELLASGSAGAAALLLERAHRAEPDARNIREALARAFFDAGRFDMAAHHFRYLIEADPVDDYAHYGLGLSLWRRDQLEESREALAVAVALRQDDRYLSALRQVKATIAARADAADAGDGDA
jgi:Flp pilus assembly protein TadD